MAVLAFALWMRGALCRQPDTSEVSLTALHRPQVAAWIERELQALLLDSDVSIVAQHTLGTVSAAFPASPQRCALATHGVCWLEAR